MRLFFEARDGTLAEEDEGEKEVQCLPGSHADEG